MCIRDSDKAGRPYILHPLRVAFKFTGDDEMYAAAVLHDVVEDSSVTIDNIFKAFSPYVAQIVDSLTRREGEVYLSLIHICEVCAATLHAGIARQRERRYF